MRCAWSRKREEGEEKGWKSGGLFFTFIIKTFRLLLFLSPFSLSLTLSLSSLSLVILSCLSLTFLSLTHSLSLSSLSPKKKHSPASNPSASTSPPSAPTPSPSARRSRRRGCRSGTWVSNTRLAAEITVRRSMTSTAEAEEEVEVATRMSVPILEDFKKKDFPFFPYQMF
jgi:hypothetical protein